VKELTVLSGKGGTGKTSLVASFASLAGGAVLADCDVDAADLHLILHPRVVDRSDFRGGKEARIDPDLCSGCLVCADLCRFDAAAGGGPADSLAMETCTIDPLACEGCGVCARFCPVGAISLEEVVQGEWFVSETRHGPMVHARLGPAAENSGKLVSIIRERARKLAGEENRDLVIVDGSPGIGCPVIASVTGSDLVLAVAEPTLSGMHDLERVASLAAHFGTPLVVAVNKCDLNTEMADRIAAWCEQNDIGVVGRIPYGKEFTAAMVAGVSVVEHGSGDCARAIEALWENTLGVLRNGRSGRGGSNGRNGRS
jgi:MinD superfamily P-loop ATPase